MKLCMLRACLAKNCRERRSPVRTTSTLRKKLVKKIYADTKRKGETRT